MKGEIEKSAKRQSSSFYPKETIFWSRERKRDGVSEADAQSAQFPGPSIRNLQSTNQNSEIEKRHELLGRRTVNCANKNETELKTALTVYNCFTAYSK